LCEGVECAFPEVHLAILSLCGGLFVGMAATPISAEWAPCQNLLATPRFGGATGQ
jgi:hypothetical protein